MRRARQDEAFQRQYENEHTWENLQEDEHGLLRVVGGTVVMTERDFRASIQ